MGLELGDQLPVQGHHSIARLRLFGDRFYSDLQHQALYIE
jgi:hypothetical protein